MSEIKSFSDYTSKYNSNVDYSALFGGTSDSSSVGIQICFLIMLQSKMEAMENL